MNPDLVVVGEIRACSFERNERVVNLFRAGAKRIGTNPDLADRISVRRYFIPRGMFP